MQLRMPKNSTDPPAFYYKKTRLRLRQKQTWRDLTEMNSQTDTSTNQSQLTAAPGQKYFLKLRWLIVLRMSDQKVLEMRMVDTVSKNTWPSQG